MLPGSLVVDAEGVEDVQEGREEGEELHERKKRKGQLAESNPISSQCSQLGEASQPRALFEPQRRGKTSAFPRIQPRQAVRELVDPEKPTLAARPTQVRS